MYITLRRARSSSFLNAFNDSKLHSWYKDTIVNSHFRNDSDNMLD